MSVSDEKSERATALSGPFTAAADVLRDSGIVLWWFDARRGRIYLRGAPFTGREDDKPKTLTLTAFLNRVHEEDRAHVRFYLERVGGGQGGRRGTQFRLKRGDGWRRLAMRGARAGDRVHGVMETLSLPVSRRLENEDMPFLLASIIEQSPVSTWVADREGYMVLINRACAELFGTTYAYAREHGVGRYNLFTDEQIIRAGNVGAIRAVFSRGETARLEMIYDLTRIPEAFHPEKKVMRLAISVFPVKDEQGRVSHAVIQHQDITDKHAIRQALDTQQRMLRDVIDGAHCSICVKDLDGRYMLVNEGFRRYTGKTDEQLLGHSTAEVMEDPAVAARLDARDREVLDSGRGLEYEDSAIDPEGRLRHWRFNRFPLLDAEGEPYATCAVATEITTEREAQEIILNVARGVSAKTGTRFFRSLVHHLAEVLHSDMAFVGELAEDSSRFVRGIAGVMDGKEMAEFNYDVTGTPCELALNKGPQFFERDIQARFPDAEFLSTQDFQASAHAPLLDAEGRPLGILVVMYRREMDVGADVISLLQLFAIRAGAELERRRNVERLKRSEERYRAFISNSSEGIWHYEFSPGVAVGLPLEEQVELMFEGCRIVECNQILADMYGLDSPEEMVGRRAADLVGHRGKQEFKRRLRAFAESGFRLTDFEVREKDRRGKWHWFRNTVLGVTEKGKVVRAWATQTDVTEIKHHLNALQYQASHDVLTDLPNRASLYSETEKAIEHAKRHGSKVALMLIDLDRFKEINDTLGHHSGDELLRQIGPRFSAVLDQDTTMIARLGGDEFGVLCRNFEDAEYLARLSHRIIEAVKRPFHIQGFTVEVGGSIGIAVYPQHGADPGSLMRCGDIAMYKAKDRGLPYAFYSSDEDEYTPRRLALMSDLSVGIRDNQLTLHYQPKVDLETGSLVGVESLVRWEHPMLGLVSPGEFIPLAEMSDLIRPLTLWVMERAMQQMNVWKKQGLDTSVAVNVSTRNLIDEDIPRFLADLIKHYEIEPAKLELEITESAIMADPAKSMETLERIHNMGVRLTIDDYGTGYSSLSYLQSLPIQTLKIDLTFVRDMLRNESNATIVRSTVNLAQNLGLNTVAEGVEDSDTLLALREAGCAEAQGYYIGKPMPPEQLVQWAKR